VPRARSRTRFRQRRNPPQSPRIFTATGRIPGTCEIVVHPNYLVIYAVETDRIEVLNVLHARQCYPFV